MGIDPSDEDYRFTPRFREGIVSTIDSNSLVVGFILFPIPMNLHVSINLIYTLVDILTLVFAVYYSLF